MKLLARGSQMLSAVPTLCAFACNSGAGFTQVRASELNKAVQRLWQGLKMYDYVFVGRSGIGLIDMPSAECRAFVSHWQATS